MEQWKQQITLANESYSKKNYELAILQYQQALILAQRYARINNGDNFDDGLSATMVSYFNMVDVYVDKELFNLAFRQFEYATEFIYQFSYEYAYSECAVKALAKAKSRLIMEWHQYVAKYRPKICNELLKTYISKRNSLKECIVNITYH